MVRALHLLWKISWVYVIESRLCEHSNVVKFEKRAAKTPQHGHRYGNIFMLYDTINTYKCFFCYNWHELCSSNKLLNFSIICCFLVKYAINYQTWMSSYPTTCYADLKWAVPSDSGAETSSYWVMPSYTAISNFSIFWGRAQAGLIHFPISVAMISMMFHRLMWTNFVYYILDICLYLSLYVNLTSHFSNFADFRQL